MPQEARFESVDDIFLDNRGCYDHCVGISLPFDPVSELLLAVVAVLWHLLPLQYNIVVASIIYGTSGDGHPLRRPWLQARTTQGHECGPRSLVPPHYSKRHFDQRTPASTYQHVQAYKVRSIRCGKSQDIAVPSKSADRSASPSDALAVSVLHIMSLVFPACFLFTTHTRSEKEGWQPATFTSDWLARYLDITSLARDTGKRPDSSDSCNGPLFSCAVDAERVDLLVNLGRVHQDDHPVIQDLKR